ncbi:MAG: hypothetical protein IKP23_04105 [Elusimicrobiaceae bacterium]|nr:hypothetical protein [Elusimicrobiaceae bacterium]
MYIKRLLLVLTILILPFALFAQENISTNEIFAEEQQELSQKQNVKPDVYVFTSPTCGHCLHFKQEFYPQLREEFKDKVNFIDIDTSDGKGNLQLRDMAAKYGFKEYGVPCLIVGDNCLMGYPGEIKMKSDKAINSAIEEKIKTAQISEVNSKEAFSKFTLTAIILNGLIDGINPCAFAVIVFLVSFLTIYRYDKKEVILIGSAYCLAVFITYILLGLGLFKALYALSGFQTFIKIFYIVTASICFILFALSVYDFLVYLKTKNSKEMLLTLSTNLKIRINKIIGFFLRGKNHSTIGLVLASLAVGFSVSLVEAVCTGQVYIPTIVLIMKDPALRLKAWLYLLMYNVMFILPLLSVFILCAIGIKSEGINNFFKKHLAVAKLCLSLVFLGLAIMLLLNI